MWQTLGLVLLLSEALAFNFTLGVFSDVMQLRYPQRKSQVRRQRAIPASTPFFCQDSVPYGRSKQRPTSVHRLRPGDIDVVAAIGDSLVAGSGALEEFALGAFVEYRGVSWCAGGDGTWREFLTLPNILKEFNPNLKGFSTGTGEWLTRNARLNVAFPVASDQDAFKQAKILVARMRSSSDIDIAQDWKMITVFIGANDLCSASCLSPVAWSPTAHARKLAKALDYFHTHLPRTIINLVPVLDVSVSVRVLRPLMCRMMHSLFCTCFHRGGGELEDLVRMARLYQKAETMLVDSGRYDTTEDFTVVVQPFMRLFNAPLPPTRPLSLVIHQSYITHDCFHFSQKGHALAANLLWNNLLEPVGNKTDNSPPVLLRTFRCPSREAPYIFTARNSKNYLLTGVQDGAQL
ncbi:phospholipase B1, membrane-associated-like isoform X2 [Pectinophora gossypiella]|uniref:phospholipase B1, membrane-associated-like isoform X2 n=1 Tax=Pectinophora gossypiella TaxID=13191 RepID=UPI00214EF0C2|nr:phospholipase B1, membrane-associated-like isoform X2 [Pectinophora gossypiella]